jgi:hypothetical protein
MACTLKEALIGIRCEKEFPIQLLGLDKAYSFRFATVLTFDGKEQTYSLSLRLRISLPISWL